MLQITMVDAFRIVCYHKNRYGIYLDIKMQLPNIFPEINLQIMKDKAGILK